MEPPEESGGPAGIATLSPPARTVVALALAAAVVGVAVHLLLVFLHVAPSNTATKKHGDLVGSYVYPEFEQNWKLFAPNPLQQNIHVWARAEVHKDDGSNEVTGWVDLTAMDMAAIRHNIAPSHTEQNQLRRAWTFYASSHGAKDKPVGTRGELSRQYLQRIVEDRFGPRLNGGYVVRLQVRVGRASVAPPTWSPEKIDTRTTFRVLPWWSSDVAARAAGDEGGEDAS